MFAMRLVESERVKRGFSFFFVTVSSLNILRGMHELLVVEWGLEIRGLQTSCMKSTLHHEIKRLFEPLKLRMPLT